MTDVSYEAAPLTPQAESSPFRFAEVAAASGIDFVHVSGATDNHYFPTTNGSGVAIFDYDNDGKLDLYFATATKLPVGTSRDGPNRLFRNVGNGQYRDATEASGLGFRGFCHGIVVGDIDNDGDQDVFLCNLGSNVLYLNNGHGTFTDISKDAGIDRPNWSSSGAFLDYDNDGDLDLYVSNYGEFKLPDDDVFCGDPVKKVRFYCHPRLIRTTRHLLYRNNGDHTFTDVYPEVILSTDPVTGRRAPRGDGRGFGVVTADINGDGKIDIFVANDTSPNFLFLNRGDGTFDDATESSGAALDASGQPKAGMAVDAVDLDGDGLSELYLTDFSGESCTLYQNLGHGGFMDATAFSGMAADTRPFIGWGSALVDLDNDGHPDSFIANGHVDDNRNLIDPLSLYAQPPLLFHYDPAAKRFRLATRDAGRYFETRHVGRAAAFGDLDDDGDIDIVVNHKDSPPALLRNETKTDHHWVRLDLRGRQSNRDAIGTRIKVEAGPLTIYRQRKGGVSLESSHDPRVLIGLGSAREIDRLTISWPSGKVTTLDHVAVDRSHAITEPTTAVSVSVHDR